MLSVNFDLFISFFLALTILYFSFIDVFNKILAKRRKDIITDTVELQKDLKFLQLERKKAYSHYLEEQSKYENWKEEAKSSYLIFYEHKKSVYDACIDEEKKKKDRMLLTKLKERKILLLNHAIDSIKEKFKTEKFRFEVDFAKIVKSIDV